VYKAIESNVTGRTPSRTLSTLITSLSVKKLMDMRLNALLLLIKWSFIPCYGHICSELWFFTWLRWWGRT